MKGWLIALCRIINIRKQRQDPEILFFFVIRVYYEKLDRMLKPLMTMFGLDLSVRLKDIAEKQVPAKLKPMEIRRVPWILGILKMPFSDRLRCPFQIAGCPQAGLGTQ